MKKLLLASSALVLSAGVAAAEVTVGGDGRMGVVYVDNGVLGNDTSFTSRIRISFTASGETDGGLAFGGSIRADNSVAGAAGTAGSVYISGAFGKLTMGDVDGAAEAAVGDVSGVGLTGIGDFNETIYFNNADRPNAQYSYTSGTVTFYASIENPTGGNSGYSVGVKADYGTWGYGAGYESADAGTEIGLPLIPFTWTATTDISQIVVGGWASFGDLTVKAQYAKSDDFMIAGLDQYGVSADYSMGATTITAFYSNANFAVVDRDLARYGIGASYDLGGGASLKGGVSHADLSGTAWESTQADFGVALSF